MRYLTDKRSDGDDDIVFKRLVMYCFASGDVGGYNEKVWAKSKL